MHDPMTVAHEIKYPWRKYPKGDKHFPGGYRETALTVWHVDPERDGSDDSCGWFAPKLNDADKKIVKELADWEEKRPYYFSQPYIHEEHSYDAEPWGGAPGTMTTYQCYRISPGDCVALVADFFHTLRWRLDQKWGLTPRLMSEAFLLGTREVDNFQSAFAFWEDERLDARRRREKIERTFYSLVRSYRRINRPWWRHPKWHMYHWKIQIPVVGNFKRWAFTRCRICGGRFEWGTSGVTNSWNAPGPRWFRSEPDLSHMDCAGHGGPVSTLSELRNEGGTE